MKIAIGAAGVLAIAVGTVLFLQGNNVAVLNPKGSIAEQQRDLIWIATALMLVVVLPVFILTGYISWKYRAGNKKARYSPEWDGNRALELTWWGFPLVIIIVLSGIIWRSSHELDPFRPLESTNKPLKVQVIAMQYKWLFIYPEENVASINYLHIPEDRPINFEITADAPMNSFWIPQLGGQVYAMAGMQTKLHLIADEPGVYEGVSANLSGEGFAEMRFEVKATSEDEYARWLALAKQIGGSLDKDAYNNLVTPAIVDKPVYFSTVEPQLFSAVLDKFISPSAYLRVEGGSMPAGHAGGSH